MIPNTGLLLELNPTRRLISIVGRKLKCYQYIQEVYWYWPTTATIPMTLIQSPFVLIKPNEDLYHHQLRTWTLECSRWNRTTENQFSPSLYFLGYSIIWYNILDKSQVVRNLYDCDFCHVKKNLANYISIKLSYQFRIVCMFVCFFSSKYFSVGSSN